MIYRLKELQGDTIAVPQLVFSKLGIAEEYNVRVALYVLATGITGMYLFHVLVNIGMTAGIMPVTGVPLPFLSYGVSSLTTNMLLAGLLLNINLRKTRLQF